MILSSIDLRMIFVGLKVFVVSIFLKLFYFLPKYCILRNGETHRGYPSIKFALVGIKQ